MSGVRERRRRSVCRRAILKVAVGGLTTHSSHGPNAMCPHPDVPLT